MATYVRVIRPSAFRTTPTKIATALGHGCEAVTWDDYDRQGSPRGRLFQLDQGRGSAALRSFYYSTKGKQRKYLTEHGVKTPDSYHNEATRYVVRPSYHSGGVDYRITDDPTDYNRAAGEYISPVFPKDREMRVIFCFGEPLIYLYKNPPVDADPELPWNYERGSTFSTYRRYRCPVRDTSFLDDVQNIPWIAEPALIGADVMMDSQGRYAVCEFNFVPAVEIEENLERIKEYALSRP